MLDRETFLRPIAHRGLHDKAKGVVENTLPAFEAAIAKSYGIECDLRPGAHGLPLVFHDETLERLTEGSGPIARLEAGCAAKLPFQDGGVIGVATFADLLAATAGRVPLFAEVKSEWTPPDRAFLAEIARLSRAYRGPLALMSFDPDVMTMLKELAPNVPHGIVSGSYFDADGTGWWPKSSLTDARRRALANLEESAHVAPSFYAYDVRALPSPVVQHVRDTERLPVLTWTVRTAEQRRIAAECADAPIFEGFLPPG
jgi:glycerophosphoryl diester phosphodiesterase